MKLYYAILQSVLIRRFANFAVEKRKYLVKDLQGKKITAVLGINQATLNTQKFVLTTENLHLVSKAEPTEVWASFTWSQFRSAKILEEGAFLGLILYTSNKKLYEVRLFIDKYRNQVSEKSLEKYARLVQQSRDQST